MIKTTKESPLQNRLIKIGDQLKEWCELIKVEHTVFALPFALSGLILGARGASISSPETFFWTIMAFTCARTAAMSLNRVIDANIDALNPRTQNRAIPQGRLNKASATTLAICSFALMLLAAWHLPPLCLKLAPLAVIWLSFYSYTKRFSSLCHLVLGIALGGATLGGWLAAGGTLGTIEPWLLSAAVTTWVAGFDIIYACQDFAFDRSQRLHSLPAKLGIAHALLISRKLHLLTILLLIAVGVILKLGTFFWIGTIVVGLMLFYEHSLVRESDLSKVNAAFFQVNGLVSIIAFIAIFLDKLTRS